MEVPEQQQPIRIQEQNNASARQSPKKQKKKKWSWKNVGSNVFLGALGIVVLILIYSFVHRTFIEPPVEPEIVQSGKNHVIQLDVLNGAGAPKLGQRCTDYLRARGFDVVEMGNYKESVERTRVIDRAGNIEAAQQVAKALGIPKERVSQQIDRSAYLDVSVVIGKDFRTLKPFQ